MRPPDVWYLPWRDLSDVASKHFCELCHFLDCDDHGCQGCLTFDSFALLKNQNIRVNLRILHRLTMGLCSRLKARHFVISPASRLSRSLSESFHLLPSSREAVPSASFNVQETEHWVLRPNKPTHHS